MPGTGKILWTSDSIRHHANRAGVRSFRPLPDESGNLHVMPGCFVNEHQWCRVPVRFAQRYTVPAASFLPDQNSWYRQVIRTRFESWRQTVQNSGAIKDMSRFSLLCTTKAMASTGWLKSSHANMMTA